MSLPFDQLSIRSCGAARHGPLRLLVVLMAMLAGCAQPVSMVEETSPAPLPEQDYTPAESDGAGVYTVLPQESLILVRVGRAGRMSRLGHDHAVASEDVQGFIALGGDPATWRADIAFPVRNLVVDKPAYRKRLGLDAGPSEDDIAGTYTNMLKVLAPQVHPWVKAEARFVSGSGTNPQISASITLHGTTFEYLLPAELETSGSRLVASGTATLRHSEFGLEPHSAVGGLLRVADELEVNYRLVARVDMRN